MAKTPRQLLKAVEPIFSYECEQIECRGTYISHLKLKLSSLKTM